jgi:hypothetical protein
VIYISLLLLYRFKLERVIVFGEGLTLGSACQTSTRWKIRYRTVHRVPQLWQTATDRVTETTFVFLPKSTTSSFQKPNRIHAMISHHQPMKTQYAQPFLRFSFTSVTA